MRRALAAAALVWAGAAVAQGSAPPNTPQGTGESSRSRSNWETEQDKHRVPGEAEVRLPAPPAPGGLIEFHVSAAASFRFFVDAASLSTGKDGVVRYTLVARSPSGYDNVSYEGMHCASGRYKVYALGGDGKWSPVNSDWKYVEPKSVQRWHQALRREYFCSHDIPVASAEDAVRYLRAGGHPDFKRDR